MEFWDVSTRTLTVPVRASITHDTCTSGHDARDFRVNMTRVRVAIAVLVVAGTLAATSAAGAYTNVATSCVTPASAYACLRVNRTTAGAYYFVVVTWDNPRAGQHHLRGVVQVCVTKLRRI